MPNVAVVYRQELSVSGRVGCGYFRRCGSRILRDSVAKKPDVVGLFGFKGVGNGLFQADAEGALLGG